MSLRSIDISKVKRLSIRNLKTEAKNKPILSPPQPLITQEYKYAPTDEKALDKPILKAIAERLDLKVMRVRSLLDEERRYTKREAIEQIVERVGGGMIKKKKGEEIFNRMLSKGTVEPIGDTGYYLLSGSTPF